MEPQTQTIQSKPRTSAKDFFVNLGAIIALYTVTGSLISLLFTVINKAYPQITTYYYPTTYSISFPVATIIIFFPIFILLMWLMSRDFAQNPSKKDLGVHKWLTYITLFVTGLAFAGDLVSVLYYFIDGQELTTGFLLKALVVLVISGLVFFYYISDTRRTLTTHEKNSWRVLAGIIVLGSIVWGFAVLGSPRSQQLIKYDEQRVSDLQNINSQIQNYYEIQHALPSSIAESQTVMNSSYYVTPTDPQTKQSYEYHALSTASNSIPPKYVNYQLCATFNTSVEGQNTPGYIVNSTPYNWGHPAGHYCFTQQFTAVKVEAQNAYPVPSPVR